ncbi:MAG: biotin/lipoyl-containing protein, partial [Pseudomonadota bacterium]
MPISITMPALSPTMEEGTLSKWLVKAGDTVEAGDIIAEIETDKATMEVEAVDEGTVVEILVAEGTEGVAVNAVIAVLAEEGEDTGSVSVESAGVAPSTAPSTGQASPPSSPPPPKPEGSGKGLQTGAGAGLSPEPAKGTGNDVSAQLASTPMKLADVGNGETRIKASPLARRIAALKGIDLAGLRGSGPHGRIVRKDVESFQPAAAAADAPAASSSRELTVAKKPEDLILPQV